jgi:hypothetical protein
MQVGRSRVESGLHSQTFAIPEALVELRFEQEFVGPAFDDRECLLDGIGWG